MPEAASLEGLKFNIGYDVSAAVKGISELKAALSGLSRYVNSSKGLGNVASTIKTLGEAIQGVRADNLLDLSNFLNALSNAKAPAPTVPKRIQEIVTAVNGITSESIQKVRDLTGALRELAEVNPAGGLKVNVSSRTDAARSGPASPFDRPAQDSGIVNMNGQLLRTQMLARGVHNVFTGIPRILSRVGGIIGTVLVKGTDLLGLGLNKAKSAALGAAYAVGKIGTSIMKTALSPVTKLVDGFKRASHAASGLLSRIGRIAMYRAIRQALQAITQGFHEGLENLYKYSQAVGTTFAGSMDRLATSALYMKNSLAAMASPIIEAIAPAIDFVVDKIVELMNWINQLFAKLTGKNTYTVAVRQATTWGDATASAGKTAAAGIKAVNDELKRSILGFDEINALTKQNTPNTGTGSGSGSPGTSSGTNYSTMFKELPIDSNISGFVDRLREAFERGDWQNIGEIIGNKLNEVVENIDTHSFGVKIGDAINAGIDVAYGFLSTTNFDKIGKKVADGINGVLETVNFEKGGAALAKSLTAKLDFIGGLLGNLNWEAAGKAVHDGVTGFFNELTAWVQSKDWEKIGSDMYKNVKDFVTNMKLDEMVSSISSFLGSAVRAVIDGAKGFFTGLGSDIKSWWETEIADADPLETTKNFLNKGVGGFFRWIYSNIVDPFATALFGKEQWDLYLADWAMNLWNGVKNNPMLKMLLTALNPSAANLLDIYTNAGLDINPEDSEVTLGDTTFGLTKDDKGNWVHSYTIEAKFKASHENSKFWRDIVETGKANGTIDANGMIDPSDKFFYNAWKSKPNSTNLSVTGYFGAASTALIKKIGKGETPSSNLSLKGYFGAASTELIKAIGKGETPSGKLSITTSLANKGAFMQSMWNGTAFGKTVTMGGALAGNQSSFFNTMWNGGGLSKNISLSATLANADPNSTFYKIWNNNVLSVQAKVKMVLDESSSPVFRNMTMWYSANGAVFTNGQRISIPQYAGGGSPHGTMFVAGEAGPEVVGHIGGRTEVLNASQMAATMYAAVIAGMSNAAAQMAATQRQAEAGASEQSRLLREQNEILSEMLAGGLVATVTTGAIASAEVRRNRRVGNFAAKG